MSYERKGLSMRNMDPSAPGGTYNCTRQDCPVGNAHENPRDVLLCEGQPVAPPGFEGLDNGETYYG